MMKCFDCKYRGSFYEDPDPGFSCHKEQSKFVFIDDDDSVSDCIDYEKEDSQ